MSTHKHTHIHMSTCLWFPLWWNWSNFLLGQAISLGALGFFQGLFLLRRIIYFSTWYFCLFSYIPLKYLSSLNIPWFKWFLSCSQPLSSLCLLIYRFVTYQITQFLPNPLFFCLSGSTFSWSCCVYPPHSCTSSHWIRRQCLSPTIVFMTVFIQSFRFIVCQLLSQD